MTEQAEKKKTPPGWYRDPKKPGQQRRWDGEHWVDEWRDSGQAVSFGQRPEGFMVVAMVLALLFGMLCAVAFQLDKGLGVFALWVSSVISGSVWTIGLVGKAVEVGVRAANRRD